MDPPIANKWLRTISLTLITIELGDIFFFVYNASASSNRTCKVALPKHQTTHLRRCRNTRMVS